MELVCFSTHFFFLNIYFKTWNKNQQLPGCESFAILQPTKLLVMILYLPHPASKTAIDSNLSRDLDFAHLFNIWIPGQG